ncbi:MAG: polysaccharide biosynthesis protein [Clostridiales bacterium]|jgi:stage V sporulation protein B|nr:polysaccharide biosynthesis protein [Clostridiales bacterium]
MNPNKEKNSFQRQAVILMVSTLIVRFLGFLYRLPMTAIIGDQGNAYYATAYNIYVFLLVLSAYGLPTAVAKLVSERVTLGRYKEAHRIFKIALFLAGIAGLTCSVFLAAFAKPLCNLVKMPQSYFSIIVLSPAVFIASVGAVFRGYFQGMKNSFPSAVSQVVEQVFNMIFSVLIAWILVKSGLELGAAGGTIGTGAGAAAGFIVIFCIYRIKLPDIKRMVNDFQKENDSYVRSVDLISEILKIAFPIIIGAAVFSLANILDTVMVKDRLGKAVSEGEIVFTEDQANALFGQLSGKFSILATMAASLSAAVAAAAVPNIASALKTGDGLHDKVNESLKLSMIISFPAATGLTILGGPIIQMLFPDNPEGGALMTYGSISVVFLAFTQSVTSVLQGAGKVSIPVIGAVAGLLVKIVLNYALISIPSVNIIGAVHSTTACYIAAGAIDAYFLRKYTGLRLNVKEVFVKPAVASLVMGGGCCAVYNVVLYALRSNTVSVLAAVVAGAAIYFFVLDVTGALAGKYWDRLGERFWR